MQAQHGSLRHCHILLTATTVQIISNTWEEKHTHIQTFIFPMKTLSKLFMPRKVIQILTEQFNKPLLKKKK